MAVQSVCPIKDRANLTIQTPYVERYTAAWKVVAEQNDEQLVVMGGAQQPPFDLPGLGASYLRDNEGSVHAKATSISVDRVNGNHPTDWIYVVQYGQRSGQGQQNPPPGDPLPGDEDPDPLQRPQRVWVEWQSYQKFLEKDVNGKQIENSAGSPFTDTQVPANRMIQVIQENRAGDTKAEYDALVDMALAIKDRTNSLTWWGRPPNTVLMLPPALNGPRYEQSKKYYEVQFRAIFYETPEEFVMYAPLDIGSVELVTVDAAEVPKEVTDGLNALTGDVKLNGISGKRLADQTADAIPLDGTAGRKGPFQLVEAIDFNTHIPSPT